MKAHSTYLNNPLRSGSGFIKCFPGKIKKSSRWSLMPGEILVTGTYEAQAQFCPTCCMQIAPICQMGEWTVLKIKAFNHFPHWKNNLTANK